MQPLNRIDINILRELQADGRIPFAELARRVGLTTTPCIERVKRLERDGYVRGYTALINPDSLAAGLIVFVQVRLNRAEKENYETFKQLVERLEPVQECFMVTGDFDFLIKARVPDMEAYRKFLSENLLSTPGVQDSNSIVVMEVMKETCRVPLPPPS